MVGINPFPIGMSLVPPGLNPGEGLEDPVGVMEDSILLLEAGT